MFRSCDLEEHFSEFSDTHNQLANAPIAQKFLKVVHSECGKEHIDTLTQLQVHFSDHFIELHPESNKEYTHKVQSECIKCKGVVWIIDVSASAAQTDFPALRSKRLA
jgi:hypothetical protein